MTIIWQGVLTVNSSQSLDWPECYPSEALKLECARLLVGVVVSAPESLEFKGSFREPLNYAKPKIEQQCLYRSHSHPVAISTNIAGLSFSTPISSTSPVLCGQL